VVDRGGIGLAAPAVTVTLNVPPGRRTFALVARFEKTLTADDDGRFRLDVPGGGVYRAIAEAEGFGPGFVDGLNPGQDTEILLLPPATLEGTCRDVDGGRPIEGATVVVTPADGTPVAARRRSRTESSASTISREAARSSRRIIRVSRSPLRSTVSTSNPAAAAPRRSSSIPANN
jgi:hypothetical protein